jgi:hypothetical protein
MRTDNDPVVSLRILAWVHVIGKRAIVFNAECTEEPTQRAAEKYSSCRSEVGFLGLSLRGLTLRTLRLKSQGTPCQVKPLTILSMLDV